MFSFKSSLLSCLALISSFQQLLNAAKIPNHRHYAHLSPRAQEVMCGTQVIITTVYILVPIYIDLYISENTTLPIYDYFTLDIKNAPTSIRSVYTGTTSSIITRSNPVFGQHSTYSAQDFSYVDGYTFIISMKEISPQSNKNAKVRRQAAVLGGQGQATTSCAEAVIYSLINGQLFANSSTGALQYGTGTGVSYANFTPSTTPGPITTVFTVDTQYNLLWSNVNFYNNQARFCVLPDDTIVAVFDDESTAPSNCVFVTLSLTRVSNCINQVGGAVLSGPLGATGQIGPTGLQGLSGPVGAIGPTGVRGPSGLSGLVGAIGPTGAVGPTGLPGISGLPGIQGPSGPPGAQGLSGLVGVIGPTGPVGVSGLPGIQGPIGPSGAQGLSGLVGAAGATGLQGVAGLVGATGPQGLSGLVGGIGPTGLPGLSGLPGVQGAVGPSGPQGVSGLSGLVGAIGPTGSQGVSGLQGLQGDPGPTGVSGLSGLVGALGPTGPSGPRGLTGVAFAYLGCYQQSQNPAGNIVTLGAAYAFDTSLSNGGGGGYQGTVVGSSASSITAQCGATCLTLTGANFFGVVNNGTTNGDCYCGKAVTAGSAGLGLLSLTKCTTCNGGVIGECGSLVQSSIAIYGRSF